MQKINLLLALCFVTLLSSCGMFGPKPQVVYHRPDVAIPQDSKLIVFPSLDWRGNPEAIETAVQRSVASGWTNTYGKKAIPAGAVIAKFAKKSGFDLMNLVKAMDNISYLEQTLKKDKKFKKFVGLVTNKFGNFDFAMSLVSGSETKYENGDDIRVHLGYFNTKTLTWKWITKITDKKGMIGNWPATYSAMISNSFDKAKEAHDAKRSLASH